MFVSSRHVITIALQLHSDVPIDFRIPSPPLFAEQLPHSLHDTVLLGVVRVILGRNLEQAWESLVVLVDAGSYALSDLHVVLANLRLLSPGRRMARLNCKVVATYVLVDQHDCNVLPLPGELVECFLDSGLLGFGIDDKVVLLRVWSFGDMLRSKSVFMRFFTGSAQVVAYSNTSQQDAGH